MVYYSECSPIQRIVIPDQPVHNRGFSNTTERNRIWSAMTIMTMVGRVAPPDELTRSWRDLPHLQLRHIKTISNINIRHLTILLVYQYHEFWMRSSRRFTSARPFLSHPPWTAPNRRFRVLKTVGKWTKMDLDLQEFLSANASNPKKRWGKKWSVRVRKPVFCLEYI